MSTRQLRKLQKQKELQELQSRKEGSDESDDDVPLPTVSRGKPSAFAGFAALGGDDDQDDNDDDDDDDQQPQPEPEQEEARIETPKASSKKSKKKKKKAKKAAVEEDAPTKDQASAQPASREGKPDDLDEIDQAIRELNLKAQASGSAGAAGATPATEAYERICQLLRTNTQHLKVMNEMRNLFGRDAMRAAQTEEQEEEQNRTRRRGQQQVRQNVDLETFLKAAPGKPLPEVTLRRNPFLQGKETWPRASTEGLTMVQINDGKASDRSGTIEFGFAHDTRYNQLETKFFQLVQLYDPMQLVYFLHQHQYHISSLIQVSKVAKQDQNSALAGDLCERALFTFGRVSVSAFRQKLEEGKARLDFSRPENRQFWLAGYHYLKSLTMKGTYRTALEWTKLLFSMDLSDPYGLIHFMHPLAIRAHESKWFIDFCDSEALDECDTAQDYIRQTLVLARLQQKDEAGAKALAVEGMERLPWLYSAIFKSLNLDVPRAIWGMEPRDEHEVLFTELYVHQTKQLWDNAQAVTLLKEAASLAQKPSLSSLPAPPVAGRNVGRFVYLDNTPALMGLVPGGMLHGFPNWDFDPLPPAKEDNIFSYDSQKFPWEENRGRAGGGLEGLNLGNVRNIGDLRQILQRAAQGGAPPEILEELEGAIANLDDAAIAQGNADGDDDGSDINEDREASPRQDGRQGLWQAFMEMLWQPRAEGDDGGNGDDYAYDGAPGGWPDDSDYDNDELPTLIREAIEDSDDEPADENRDSGTHRR
ncbi:hypothetical protein JX265_010984 [Neoarthrinium moseri]|uniref:Nulp1-pending protein n=1 Tax=Neoarthrinium moseri TaxID=1658444 RepID=A0A9Q0AHY6_9PEZI|nr:hypothetical protein JX266_003212 [Neoarthrinium moseri]KAI1857954.1 hypothetical protein JX265_010984 [Neoarthrinium moseri]